MFRAFRSLLLGVAFLTVLLVPAQAADTLTVFAASSLTEFTAATKAAFEKTHPGVNVRINLASSTKLRTQIEQGAPADIFMSADTANMQALASAGQVVKPVVFAFNRVTMIIPKSNPANIQSLADVAKPKLKLIIAAPDAPIGKYTLEVLDKMDASGKYGKGYAQRVLKNVKSQEPAVKAVVTKVSMGEADAGFCYISDVTPAIRSTVKAFRIPDSENAVASYPIGVMKDSKQQHLAQEFVKFVLSKEGQKLLGENGFITRAQANKARLKPS